MSNAAAVGAFTMSCDQRSVFCLYVCHPVVLDVIARETDCDQHNQQVLVLHFIK
jgi:hypothetical protein